MYRNKIGELIIPVLAVGFSLYMLVSQYIKDYRPNTIVYCLFLVIPILICSLIAFFDFYKSVRRDKENDDKKLKKSYDSDFVKENYSKNYKKVALIFIISFLFLFLLTSVGYLLAYFILLILLLPLMGVRSVYAVLIISLVLPIIFHFVFVKAVGMQLPPGFLEILL